MKSNIVFTLTICLFPTLATATEHFVNSAQWGSFNFAQLQPGDILTLTESTYPGEVDINGIHGTHAEPITIRSSPGSVAQIGQTSDDDGGDDDSALTIRNSSHVVFERLKIINESGIDGETSYSTSARTELHDGLRIIESDYIMVTDSLFSDIATRGVFVSGLGGKKEGIIIKNNIFIDIGDDTASAAISIGKDVISWKITDNIIATNVDNIVAEQSGSNGLIYNNLLLDGRHENLIDIKAHYPRYNEADRSIIHSNYMYSANCAYSGVEIQNSSSGILVSDNAIYDSGLQGALLIRGRCESTSACAPIKDIILNGNSFYSYKDDQTAVKLAINSSRPSDVTKFVMYGNMIFKYDNWIGIENFSYFNHSGSTDGWTFNLINNTSTGSHNIATGVDDITFLQFNQENQTSESSYAEALDYTSRELNLQQTLQSTFDTSLIKQAYNKAGIPHPVLSQDPDSENLVIKSTDIGLYITNSQTDTDWSLEADNDALSLNSLRSRLSASSVIAESGKIKFRVRFTNPGYSSYTLYARVRCGTTVSECTAGDSFWAPTGLDTDDTQPNAYNIATIPNDPQYQWISLGSYNVNPGLFHTLSLGARENKFRIDALVFDTRDDLISLGQQSALDNLVSN